MKINTMSYVKLIKVLKLAVPTVIFAVMAFSAISAPVGAQTDIPPGCPGGPAGPPAPGTVCPGDEATSVPNCPEGAPLQQTEGTIGNVCGDIEADCDPGEDGAELNEGNCRILQYLLNGINFLSAVVGIVAVFSIIWAGYQYMMARDNSQAVSAAKSRIITTIIALVLYMFMWAFLQWVVPGGVL